MNLGPHTDFIVLAYMAASVVIGALIAWVLLDYRTQTRLIADLDAQGVKRRSQVPSQKQS